MNYKVIKAFKVRTPEGDEKEIKPGQVVALTNEQAIRLLNEDKISPVEKVAYKIYSEILQAYLWVVEKDNDLKSTDNNYYKKVKRNDETQ